MGDLLQFPTARARRPRHAAGPPAFFFDVVSPLSYLAAERVERTLADVEWVVVDGTALAGESAGRPDLARLRAQAEARARALRLPLVWPDEFPVRAPCARRAAAYACEIGAGPAFALAASRLAFCGGFDLEDPETLAEAAAAAGVPLDACLEAAGETWRDEQLDDVAASLCDAGVDELPAFRVGGHWLVGDGGLAAASALLAETELARRSLAPVG
jgi:2-hydroxychromene-2-carboxylate isomerase